MVESCTTDEGLLEMHTLNVVIVIRPCFVVEPCLLFQHPDIKKHSLWFQMLGSGLLVPLAVLLGGEGQLRQVLGHVKALVGLGGVGRVGLLLLKLPLEPGLDGVDLEH